MEKSLQENGNEKEQAVLEEADECSRRGKSEKSCLPIGNPEKADDLLRIFTE